MPAVASRCTALTDPSLRRWLAPIVVFTLLWASRAPAFDVNDGYAPELNGTVDALAVQPDGSALVGGGFTSIGGVSCVQLCRLSNDGAIAPGFGPTGLNGPVRAILTLPDGSAIVGGAFTQGFGRALSNVLRLNVDGSLSSLPIAGTNGQVRALAVQPDGRLLIGGTFTQVGNPPRLSTGVARLHSDGRVDSTFNATINGTVRAIALLPDGRIVVGGQFSTASGVERRNLAVLRSGGQVQFDAGFNTNGTVNSLTADIDGTLVIGGDFTEIGNVALAGLARMTPDGAMVYGLADAEAPVRALHVHSDGQLILGGDFLAIDNQPRARLARLDQERNLDPIWRAVTGGSVHAIAEQPDGGLLVGGNFTTANGEARSRLMRVTPQGQLETTLRPSASAGSAVRSTANQADGGLLVAGSFTSFGGQPREGIARLRANGQIDLGFNPSIDGGEVRTLVALDDGAVLLSGSFTSVNGNPRSGLAKLLANGSLDSSFITPIFSNFGGPTFPAEVSGVYPAQRGRLYVTGSFDTVNTQPSEGVVRLRASNGRIESSLAAKVQPGVTSLIEAADESLLIVGGSTVNEIPQPARLSRLLPPDGSLDANFVPQIGAGNEVTQAALLPDGKIIVALRRDAVTSTFLRRLNPDGSLDSGFTASTNGPISSITLRADGVIAIAGDFSTAFGVARSGYALLRGDTGTLDTGPLPSTNGTVLGARFQSDGKLILTGSFSSVDGQARPGLARLSTPEAARYALQLDGPIVRWLRGGAAPELTAVPRLWGAGFGQTPEPQQRFARIPGGWQVSANGLLHGSFLLRLQPRSIEHARDGASANPREYLKRNDFLFADGFELGDPN